MQQIAAAGELECGTLEDTLPVSKPTISYHLKILHQAGLIDVGKSGRNRYYSVRREALRKLLDDPRELGRGRKRADAHAHPASPSYPARFANAAARPGAASRKPSS
jgi:DNA-binding transcriptional ArsR family regulator